jgi:penicillin-insensitive murein endopeptidase
VLWLLALLALEAPDAGAVAAVWNAQREPAPGPAQAIGGYSNGCLQGAVRLSPSGPGWELLHLGRHRNFGHPDLVAYIERLAANARKQHLGPVVVGDLGQARGGPTPSGHRSHQSGLDVDIGYAAPAGLRPGHVKAADRERIGPLAVVDLRTHKMTPPWGRRVQRLLAAAASDPAVDRVFVNPAVKRTLCAGPARREPWLARLRPWWGHHDHFHVRLRCPDGSPLCRAQDPPRDADGDGVGCGASLDWWFTDDAQAARTRRQPGAEAEAGPPPLPPACAALIASSASSSSTASAATPAGAAARTDQAEAPVGQALEQRRGTHEPAQRRP